MSRRNVILNTLSAGALLLLAACGGGSGTDTATPQPASPAAAEPERAAVRVIGTVTGFGSVIIQGVKYDDNAAVVHTEFDPAAKTLGSLADVKLGSQVEGLAKDGKLSEITLRASLAGPVGSVNVESSTFTVLNQTVRVVSDGPTPTVLEGLTDLSAISAGEVVEVHGSWDATQRLVATRVERKAPSDIEQGVLLTGKVAGLDEAGKTFSLNEQKIRFEGATTLPSGTALANGQWVAVYTARDSASAGTLQAQAVRIMTVDEGSTRNLGGRIAAFKSLADFSIGNTRVDASAAAFELGTGADLAANVLVYVEGKIQAGVLKAEKVRVFKHAADIPASLRGEISDFISASSFRLRGAVVDASTATFKDGTSADLGNGAFVQVTGSVRGEVLRAERVEFVSPPLPPNSAAEVKLRGEVRELDATARTFRFLGVQVQLASDVQYVGGMASDLVNGRLVEITATPTAAAAATGGASTTRTLKAKRVEFLSKQTQTVFVAGRVSDLQADSFKVAGARVTIGDGAEFVGGTKANLAHGVEVQVRGNWNVTAKALVANRIEIRKSMERASGVRVAGTIADFESSSSFRIGVQKVDASSATLTGGVLADLANGIPVEGTGTVSLVQGVPVAKLTALRFLR